MATRHEVERWAVREQGFAIWPQVGPYNLHGHCRWPAMNLEGGRC